MNFKIIILNTFLLLSVSGLTQGDGKFTNLLIEITAISDSLDIITYSHNLKALSSSQRPIRDACGIEVDVDNKKEYTVIIEITMKNMTKRLVDVGLLDRYTLYDGYPNGTINLRPENDIFWIAIRDINPNNIQYIKIRSYIHDMRFVNSIHPIDVESVEKLIIK